MYICVYVCIYIYIYIYIYNMNTCVSTQELVLARPHWRCRGKLEPWYHAGHAMLALNLGTWMILEIILDIPSGKLT